MWWIIIYYTVKHFLFYQFLQLQKFATVQGDVWLYTQVNINSISLPGCWRQLHWSTGILHGSLSSYGPWRDGPQSQSGGRGERAGCRHANVFSLQSRPSSSSVLVATQMFAAVARLHVLAMCQFIVKWSKSKWSSAGCHCPYVFCLLDWPDLLLLEEEDMFIHCKDETRYSTDEINEDSLH